METACASWELNWTSLCERLNGLLALETDDHGDSLSSADHHWLVVHVHKVGRAKLMPTCGAALEAAAELMMATEMARSSSTAHAKLWKAVLTSSMMVTPLHEGQAALWRATRPSTGYLPSIRLLVDLGGENIAAGLIRGPLTTLFHTVRVPPVRPVTVGVRMAKCRLNAEGIAILDAILTGRSAEPNILVASALGRLDLSDNGLTPDSLLALARLLNNHTVRELRLENVLGRASSPETVKAFKAVMTSAFQSERHDGIPLSISLAGNSFNSQYFEVIADAMQAATRPLRTLSLARTFAHSTHAIDRALIWRQLTRIFVAQEPKAQAYSTECELDLSGNSAFQQDADIFQKTFVALIDDQINTMREALSNGTPVWCRVVSGARHYSGPSYSDSVDEVEVAVNVRRVMDASVDGWIQVTGTDEARPVHWIVAGAIAELRLGDLRYLLRPRFTSLVIDDLRISDSRVIAHVLTPIGFRLRKLSLHLVFTAFARITDFLQLCPHLTHLDLAGCRLYDAADLWTSVRNGIAQELQSLNLAGNLLGARGAEELTQVLHDVPQLRLRHVKLNQNHIGHAGLVHLTRLLQQNATLEIVELDGAIEQDVNDAYASLRRLLSQRHDGERLTDTPLPRDARLAFLQAMTVLSRCYEALHAMDTPVVALIMEFAADRVTRQLEWHV